MTAISSGAAPFSIRDSILAGDSLHHLVMQAIGEDVQAPASIDPTGLVLRRSVGDRRPESAPERLHRRRHPGTLFNQTTPLANLFECVGTLRVGRQELAEAGVRVVDDQHRLQARVGMAEPEAHEIVRQRDVLLAVVVDQVTVLCKQMVPRRLRLPDQVPEQLQAEREVEQVALRAELAVGQNRVGDLLDVVRGEVPADPGCPQIVSQRFHRDVVGGRLVEIVEQLTVEPVPRQLQVGEIPLLDQRRHQPRHEILRHLVGQKRRLLPPRERVFRMLQDLRPEQRDVAPRQAADRSLAQLVPRTPVEGFFVREGVTAVGGQQQDAGWGNTVGDE